MATTPPAVADSRAARSIPKQAMRGGVPVDGGDGRTCLGADAAAGRINVAKIGHAGGTEHDGDERR